MDSKLSYVVGKEKLDILLTSEAEREESPHWFKEASLLRAGWLMDQGKIGPC